MARSDREPVQKRESNVISDHPLTFEEFSVHFDQSDIINFRELVEVSDSLMAGYARFARHGLPSEAIGIAMLGATLNLYDVFGMKDDLPRLLRGLADRIEASPTAALPS